MSDRNAEIWSTRVQREIIALKSCDNEGAKKQSLLPPFISVVDHHFDLEAKTATVEFRIEVEFELSEAVSADDGDEKGDENKTKKDVGENKGGEESEEQLATEGEGTAVDPESNLDGEGDPEQLATSGEVVDNPTPACVILVLDASLCVEPGELAGDASSQSQSTTPMCYPFQKPHAIIKSGSALFSGESPLTVKDGDQVEIDLDWTPSIHLSDAVTHVALKIRECVKRGEPLFPLQMENTNKSDEELLSESIAREARESILETKKAMSAMFSSFAAKGSSIANKGQSLRNTLSSNISESLSALANDTAKSPKKANVVSKETNGDAEGNKETKKVVQKGLPEIGDEIDLSESPWNKCIGMYSCKAIKRPEFVVNAIAEAASKKKKDKEVASSGFAGASSMFSRFAESAKSVMEESFLLITELYIIEFKSNKLNIGSGTVTFAIHINHMAKLKFRREESLSLFFKEASDEPLVFMCLDSAAAVQDIQNILKRHGVKGKHTNAATQRAVQMALNKVALIQQKEKELLENPTVKNVNEIMDLYRQAAENFESAGDPRHSEVVAHMKRFLNQKFTTNLLEPVPQGEILQQCPYLEDADDDDDDHDDHVQVDTHDKDAVPTNKNKVALEESMEESIEETMQNMDSILEEAKRDMEDFGVVVDDIDHIISAPSEPGIGGDVDAFAELDAMLSDADKELDELMNS